MEGESDALRQGARRRLTMMDDHGGIKVCNENGCIIAAQLYGLCWKHGGYKRCKQDGCEKQANRNGGMCQACYTLSQS